MTQTFVMFFLLFCFIFILYGVGLRFPFRRIFYFCFCKALLETERLITNVDPIEVLKKNVSDTLSFLHQERNDFLPLEDELIPSRKDDHVSLNINLDIIKKKGRNDVEAAAANEIGEVIRKAEEVVNDLQQNGGDISAVIKSEEAFKFLENEASSPILEPKSVSFQSSPGSPPSSPSPSIPFISACRLRILCPAISFSYISRIARAS